MRKGWLHLKYMQTRFLFILLLLLSQRIWSQQAGGRQYIFSYYNTTTGSVSNQVNDIIQDEQGYIWTATTEGLQRFDGSRYRIFRYHPRDPASLPINPILQVQRAGKNELWVLLANGQVGLFNTQSFNFRETTVQASPAQQRASHRKLLVDVEGRTMLLLGGQVLLGWDKAKNQFNTQQNFITLTDSMRINDIVLQPGTRKFWISTNLGLLIYNHATSRLSYGEFNRENEPAIEKFRELGLTGHLMFDRRGRLWFESWKGGTPLVYAYNTRSNQFDVFAHNFLNPVNKYFEIRGFFEQSDSSVWVHGLSVLARHDHGSNRFEIVPSDYRDGKGISYDAVTAMYEDREKNIWVATGDNGLFRFNPTNDFFLNIPHANRSTGMLGSGSVMSFAATPNGQLLVATWGESLFRYNREMKLLPPGIQGVTAGQPTIWNMKNSANPDILWAVGQPGIYRIRYSTGSMERFLPPQLGNRTIRQVEEDREGHLWLGMQSIGLYLWDRKKGEKRFEEGVERFIEVPAGNINRLLLDREGLLWVGTAADGAYVINPVTRQVSMHFSREGNQPFRLNESAISGFLDYDDSLLLISTSTQIFAYNRKLHHLRSIALPDGISGFISSMERDARGYLWLGTTSGLYRVDLRRRLAVRFTREDGIVNDRFTLASSYALPDGRLAFGSSNQFVIFDPSRVFSRSEKPRVMITGFRVMNKPLRLDSLEQLDLLRLKSQSNSIHIDFSTLRYAVRYQLRYMLEGLDKDWQYAQEGAQAIYSYLPGGTYTLKLQALNEEGEYGEETRLRIRVQPPFWKSWWFFSGVVLIIAGVLFWLDRERTRRKKALQDMRTDISSNLHGEINNALSNINILSEMARLKAEKDPAKASEYVEQIHTRSHHMIIAMDDMLWSLDPQNDNMQKTVERMREYIDALNNRHGVYIELEVERRVEQVKLNMKLRHDAFLLFKEGILNLVQAGVDICHIHFSLEKSKLLFLMQFDTERADMQQLNNLFQRHDMEKRIEALNAAMEVKVQKNATLVRLEIPVG